MSYISACAMEKSLSNAFDLMSGVCGLPEISSDVIFFAYYLFDSILELSFILGIGFIASTTFLL
jgi:hypothetical protein